MTNETQETEVVTASQMREHAINVAMRDFIIGSLGMPSKHGSIPSVTGNGKESISHYQHGTDTIASLGRYPRASMDVKFILGERHRISMTAGLGSYANRILCEIINHQYTPYGINFEASKQKDSIEYLFEVCEMFEEFYHKHVRSAGIQPFAYAEYKRVDTSRIDVKFVVGHGDATMPVSVMSFELKNLVMLNSLNYNISEDILRNVSKSIMSMVYHLDGNPFSGKEYRTVNYPSIDFNPASVMLMLLRTGVRVETPEQLYAAYIDVVKRSAKAGVFDNFNLSEITPFDQLAAMEKSYLATMHTLVITMFNSLIRNRNYLKVQAS